MSSPKTAKKLSGPYPQKVDLQDGNAMGAISGMHIDFDVVGYYPITPSTQVAETLDALKAAGEHDITMIPGDGEHGAAGICFGAPAGGASVFKANSYIYGVPITENSMQGWRRRGIVSICSEYV